MLYISTQLRLYLPFNWPVPSTFAKGLKHYTPSISLAPRFAQVLLLLPVSKACRTRCNVQVPQVNVVLHSPYRNEETDRTNPTKMHLSLIYVSYSRLNSASNSSGLGAPWRHSMSRDLGRDMDSMLSRTGATLPRGEYHRLKSKYLDQ